MGAILLLLVSIVSAQHTRVQPHMGTLCEIEAYGSQEDISAAFAEIARWDQALSHYKKESELALALSDAYLFPRALSPMMEEAFKESLRLKEETNGLFDVGYRSLRSARNGMQVENGRLRLVPGGTIDFGGIGKGLAIDHAARVLRERGVTAALINFGGHIYALGSPPETEGWVVRAEALGRTLVLRNASIAISSDSEQPGHIWDPRAGRSARRRGAFAAIMPTGTDADGWTKALYLAGTAPAGFRGCGLLPGGRSAGDCSRFAVKPSGEESVHE